MSPSSPDSQRSTGLGSSVRCDCPGSWHLPGGGTPSTTGETGNLGGKEEEPGTTNLNPEMGLAGLGINAHAITDIEEGSRPLNTSSPETQFRLCLQPAVEAWTSYFWSLGPRFSHLSNENDTCTVEITKELSQMPLRRVNIHLVQSQK